MIENPEIHRDLFRAVCGEELGRGMNRIVYACTINPDWVVKIEEPTGNFQNVTEWLIWTEAKGRPHVSRYLAPCHYMSPNGTILIQSRTQPALRYPDRMPKFLTDFKRQNYGLLKNRLVCHDYGTALVLDHGFSTTLRKVSWWDDK